jgi:hypothetical protein
MSPLPAATSRRHRKLLLFLLCVEDFLAGVGKLITLFVQTGDDAPPGMVPLQYLS